LPFGLPQTSYFCSCCLQIFVDAARALLALLSFVQLLPFMPLGLLLANKLEAVFESMLESQLYRLESKLDTRLYILKSMLESRLYRLESKLDTRLYRLKSMLESRLYRLENKLDTSLVYRLYRLESRLESRLYRLQSK
jgi:hypothetical protein